MHTTSSHAASYTYVLLLLFPCLLGSTSGILFLKPQLPYSTFDVLPRPQEGPIAEYISPFLRQLLIPENYYDETPDDEMQISKRRPFHRFLRFGRNVGYPGSSYDKDDSAMSMEKRGPFLKIGKIPSSAFLRYRAPRVQPGEFQYRVGTNSVIRVGKRSVSGQNGQTKF